MILCITPNPAIDRTLVVPDFGLNRVHRATRQLITSGGKGINAARAIQHFGGKAICRGFMGGDAGQEAARLSAKEGLDGSWTWISGETRTCIIIVDAEKGHATVINESGPTATTDDWERLNTDIFTGTANVDCICVGGSLPPNSPIEAYLQLLTNLVDTAKPVWVDIAGEPLQRAIEVKGIHVKVNHEEIGSVLGYNVGDVRAGLRTVELLMKSELAGVALTLGEQGAVLMNREGLWWAQPPKIRAVSGVGSGDSFMGGLSLALSKHLPYDRALAWAVAAGAANVLSIGSAQFSRNAFEDILAATVVHTA